MARARGPARACTTSSRSFKELYDEQEDLTSFLFSDEEQSGSDLEDESLDEDDSDAKIYDPAASNTPYDKKQGDDAWIGRRVRKNFGELGAYTGVVYKARKDRNKPAYRLFAIYYFDDNTFEEVWPKEIASHLLPEDKDGLDLQARQRYDNIAGVVKSQWSKKKKKTSNPTPKKRKPSNKGDWTELPTGKRVYFLLDGETTGVSVVVLQNVPLARNRIVLCMFDREQT